MLAIVVLLAVNIVQLTGIVRQLTIHALLMFVLFHETRVQELPTVRQLQLIPVPLIKLVFEEHMILVRRVEGIVPTFIGAIPKDPGGTGFMGTGQTFTDAQTGYVAYNVPTPISVSSGTVTMSSVGTAVTTSASTTIINPGDVITASAQSRIVVSGSGTAYVTDTAFSPAIVAGTAFTVTNVARAAASNRVKVVSCNPNDSDSDGSYANNKIEVLR